jgi:uncharacterized protein YhhL (DUF1145 family)
MKKSVLSTRIFSILGLIFAILALVMSFLPIRMFALIPASVGLLCGIISLLIAYRYDLGKKLIYTLLIISAASILITGASLLFFKDTISKDKQFDNTIEKSKKDAENDLEDALKDAK